MGWFLEVFFTCVEFGVILANVRFPEGKRRFSRSNDVKDDLKIDNFKIFFLSFFGIVFLMNLGSIWGGFGVGFWIDFSEMSEF